MRLEDCIRQLMVDDCGSVKGFAESVGIPPTTIYNILNRGISNSGYETVQRIYSALGLNYRVIGFDDMDYVDFKARRDRERDSDPRGFAEVPVYGRIAAGMPVEMEEGDFGFPCPTYLRRRHPRSFFLVVDGESMNRVLPNGCYALIDPDRRDPVISGNAYAVCVNGYDATVKRVKVLANGIALDPDSTDPTYHPMVYDGTIEGTESITIIGEVVWYAVPFDFVI